MELVCMRFSRLLLVCLFFSVFANASTSEHYAQRLARLSVNEGLSQSMVNQIVQDDLGYVWIGTEQGLNRYDGFQINIINKEVDLSDKPINLLKKLNNGLIFVSTTYAGSFVIDPKTLAISKLYSGKLTPESTLYSPISAVVERGNKLYVGIERQVFTIDLRTLESTYLIALPDTVSLVRAMAFVGNDLIIGSDVGLYRFQAKQHVVNRIPFLNQVIPDSLNENVKYLKFDTELGLLIGTVKGLYALPFDDNEFQYSLAYTLVPNLNIWDYEKTSYGEFIATELGLFELNRKTLEVKETLSFADSLFNMSNISIYDLMIDNNNVMWMASREQGALYWPLQATKFHTVQLEPSPLNSNTIWSIHQTSDALWMGTDNGIVKVVNGEVKQHFYKNTDPKEVFGLNAVIHIASVEYQQKSLLMLETATGIELLDPESGNVTGLDKFFPAIENDNYLQGVFESKDKIYFGSNKNYYQCNKVGLDCSVIPNLVSQLPTNLFYKFLPPLPTHPNDLLISANSKLLRYNIETGSVNTVFSFGEPNSSSFAVVDSWVLDSDSVLWLATSTQGLVGIDVQTSKQIRTFDSDSGLLTNIIYEVRLDKHGNLWASSQKGLYQINLNTNSINIYNHQSGLAVDEFNSGASGILSNGDFAFGSVHGLLVLNPDSFAISATPPQIEFTELSIMSREDPFPITDKLELKHDDVGLLIRFSTFDFLNQHNNYVSATLSGATEATYDDIKLGKLFFSQLKAGEYKLDVYLKEKGNNRTVSQRTLAISVAYTPFLSPVAVLLYCILSASLLFTWYFQNRKKQNLIRNALETVKNNQKQTSLALKATNSGVWEVSIENKKITQQRLFLELGYEELSETTSINDHVALIHPDDLSTIQLHWQALIKERKQDSVFEVTYRMKAKNGDWIWYHDVGRISQSNDHGALTVSGIYSNITEQKASNLMAAILGDAFGQINDWLLILDSTLTPIAANSSFCYAFNLDNNKIKLATAEMFKKALGNRNYFSLLISIKKLQPRANLRSEVTLKTSHHPKHPIQLSINAIAKHSSAIDYYVIVLSDLTEQKKNEREFRFLANYDSLTGLPNRNLMLKRIQKAINSSQQGNMVGLLFIDLDKFKPINDSYGHDVGDKLLSAISRRIESKLPRGCTLGRQSGDEFLVLIENVNAPEKISELVQALLISLPEKISISGFTVSISASIGVAIYPFDANNAEKLIRHADVAMIHAKQSGRNSFKFFTQAMNDEILRKLQLETAIKVASKEDCFFNHYQPIVNNTSGQVVGVELLMRWQHEGQFISPAEFIPVAEEIGLIEVMTDQALKRALVELKPLLLKNGDFYISLNLSAIQVLRANIAEHLVTILYECGVPCSRLRLEITESTLLADKVKAKTSLHELNEQGFILLLDDFGTGYSSLTYLSHFPIDVIKIDQGFVRSMENSLNNRSIVKTITMLAQNLGITCIAEGVESPEHVRYLSQLGITHMQGYYFSKPVSAAQLLSDNYINKVGKTQNNPV